MTIMAFDPGQTTGWAGMDWPRGSQVSSGIIGPYRHHLELWGLLETMKPERVIMEHFIPQGRGNAPASALVLISRDYEGVIELWCLMHDVPLIKQNASEGKGIFTKQKLTALALWRKTTHERDAISHLLHYITTDLKDHRWIKAAAG